MSDQKVHWHHDGPALNRSLFVEQEHQHLVDPSEVTRVTEDEEGVSQAGFLSPPSPELGLFTNMNVSKNC